MDTLLVCSISLFALSILFFFMINGREQLTLKQIFILSGRKLKCSTTKYLIIGSTFSELLLIASVVGLIIHFDYPLIVEFLGGLMILFMQKIIILLILKLKHLIDI